MQILLYAMCVHDKRGHSSNPIRVQAAVLETWIIINEAREKRLTRSQASRKPMAPVATIVMAGICSLKWLSIPTPCKGP